MTTLPNYGPTRALIAFALIASMLLALVATPNAWATDNETTSRELTLLYRSARAVISDAQSKINDPALGDKGLGADAVVAATLANYESASGARLDMSSNAEAK